MSDNELLTSYTEVFVMGDEDGGEFRPHFECSHCPRNVDEEPCPDHAPTGEIPGLRLIPCDAGHYTWIHNRDDYGAPCPWCLVNDYAARQREAEACRHWPWRHWKLTHRAARLLCSLGVTSGGYTWTSGNGHSGCMTHLPGSLRGKRLSVLFVSRGTWRCWLKGHHRRGEEIGLWDYCGKCVPWPCCGSERVEHADGCAEADA